MTVFKKLPLPFFTPKIGKNQVDVLPLIDNSQFLYNYHSHIYHNYGTFQEILCSWQDSCPICLFAEVTGERALKAKHRIALHVVHDNQLKIWTGSHFLIGKILLEMVEVSNFADPMDGCSVYFFKKGNGILTNYEHWCLLRRKKPIETVFLEQRINFLDYLIYPTLENQERVISLFAKNSPKTVTPVTPLITSKNYTRIVEEE